MIMQDGTNEPATVPVPTSEKPGPTPRRRTVLLLGLGGGVGLALGVLLTFGVFTTYTFVTQTLPSTRDSVQVFNELNELRQQINQLNEERKLKDQEKEDAVRQALSAVSSTVHPPENATPSAAPPPKKEGGAAEMHPVEKRRDGFAEIDEEIERLEQTQKVLNTILDLFSRKAKERPKEQ
jgi:hypothetical protein